MCNNETQWGEGGLGLGASRSGAYIAMSHRRSTATARATFSTLAGCINGLTDTEYGRREQIVGGI